MGGKDRPVLPSAAYPLRGPIVWIGPLFAQSNLQMCKEGVRYYHLDGIILHPPSQHRVHLKHLKGKGEWYHTWLHLAPSTCTQQAALAPLLANMHLHPYPGPILALLQLLPGQVLWIKQGNASTAVRVENRCPKSGKSACSCFVFQTFHYKFYFMFNVTLLEWHLPGHRRQSHGPAQSFFFNYLGSRLLSPGILIRLVWFWFFLKHI